MYRMPGAGITTAGGTAGTLAYTGADVGWWIALGVILVLAGIAALVAATRRSRRLAGSRK
ncbi:MULTISPECIES: LPXTG cell wall anchor domain-containing protein [Amycolatopsis]|uniref:LPXTG-motif cell wall-anchored protein n=1 Tax=Amycolatopsis viridis TaxID=185678 RepID=A0ABX0SY51_9PSEU|nr:MULTISPECIES: LPXTG cell wall anchor domain-containing protein [Amycolatopsis]NIH80241.1 LPXTG-motif cell wall-anchored protein [Amycolatopsis viridis]NIH83296.1 LPXTG-motif cell wall-anchored protein [Amycolatopsis granulosa]